jgi:hypothetical protein
LIAADAIITAIQIGEEAEKMYFEALQPMLSAFANAHEVETGGYTAAKGGGDALIEYLSATRGRDFHLDY